MNHFLRYTSFLILFFVSTSVLAQESECAFKLQEAEDSYESGILDSIPSMLRLCINNDGFDNEELARAYKLLIKTYLFEDYQEMAELTMLKFLKKFPEYEIKPTDPVEFTYLYESYQTVPIYSIGVIAGLNYSMIRIIEPHSIYSTDDYDGEYSGYGTNFQAGIQIKRYINKNIDLNLDIIYVGKQFEFNLSKLDSEIKYIESQSMLSIPLSGTYDFQMGKVSPYARLGVNLDYLFAASASVTREIINAGVGVDRIVSGSDIDIRDNRSQYNVSALIGAGLKWNFKKGYAMFDVRYQMGFTNNVIDNNRYLIEDLWSRYNYVDNDFTINNIMVSFGYVQSFYKTKNKK